MSFDEKTVAKVARLSRIGMPEADAKRYAGEIDGILHWVEQLQQVNTDDVPQMASAADLSLPWRNDLVNDGNCRDKVLANAPKQEYGCFAVPKVIE